MNASLINPYLRLTMRSELAVGQNISRRVIYDYELIYIERGEFTFIYDDAPYRCAAGDVIFIRPGVPHSFIIDTEEISQPHIHFDITHRRGSEIIPISFKDACAMTDSEREWIHKDYFTAYAREPKLKVSDMAEFLELFFLIISKSTDELVKKALLIQLLAMIIKDNFSGVISEEEQPTVAHQIKDYIDAGNGMGMTLDGFARSFYYDKFYLERKFKDSFGVGVIEYRNEKRMELAAELLKKKSVSSVAEMLGCRSIYSFSRAFKMRFGYPPSKETAIHKVRKK